MGGGRHTSPAAPWVQAGRGCALQVHQIPIVPREFARRLWGDYFFHPDARVFKQTVPEGGGERTFVEFVLEPLYKMYSQVCGLLPSVKGATYRRPDPGNCAQ